MAFTAHQPTTFVPFTYCERSVRSKPTKKRPSEHHADQPSALNSPASSRTERQYDHRLEEEEEERTRINGREGIKTGTDSLWTHWRSENSGDHRSNGGCFEWKTVNPVQFVTNERLLSNWQLEFSSSKIPSLRCHWRNCFWARASEGRRCLDCWSRNSAKWSGRKRPNREKSWRRWIDRFPPSVIRASRWPKRPAAY